MEDSYLECVRCNNHSTFNMHVFHTQLVCVTTNEYFRKLNSNDHWCECADGTDLTQGWCVATYLKEARVTDYIRIQKELLKVKDRLGRHSEEGEEPPLFIMFLQVTLLLIGSFITLLMLLLMGRKIASVISSLKVKYNTIQ